MSESILHVKKRTRRNMKKPLKVLVVDDEESVLNMYKRFLEKKGYEVITASTCEDGIEKAKSSLPDLTLLDFNTKSTINGVEASQLLREWAGTANMPIIIASGHDKEEMNIPPHIEMSLSAVLKKPMTLNRLIEAIQEALKEIPPVGI